MAVAPHGLVHRREPIFGAEVDVSPSLHQDPDGLAAAGLTLHSEGQGRLCGGGGTKAFVFKNELGPLPST